jgi:hypothetical protein
LRIVSGNILIAGCCCTEIEEGYGCGYCEVTPKYWTVTLSGVTACGACDNCGDGSSVDSYAVSGLNGTHVLTQVGSGSESTACKWQVTGVGSWSVRHYDDTTCGAGGAGVSGDMRITLYRFETKWRLLVEGVGHSNSPTYSMFWDEVNETVDDACLDIATMTNERTCGVCSDDVVYGEVYAASGGTATLEAGDQS